MTAQPHEITHERERNVVRIACTCGHRGPWRRAALARNDLIRDEADHRTAVRYQNWRP